MRIVRFMLAGRPAFGVLAGETVTPLRASVLEDALDEARSGSGGTGEGVDFRSVRLIAPVARPGKILGIGVNYAAHAAESVSFVTASPGVQKWFNKQATAVNGPYDPVHLPAVSGQLDYEGELVVIIGRHGRHVPAGRAMEIVAGFAVGCDYSVRDWQKASQTMIMGKGFDTHAVFGPALVTPDEVADLSGLQIRTYVNGELRQSAVAGEMIHKLPEQIAHLTAAFTLEPGDVLYTGTPAGVGAGFDPPRWLRPGDRVRVEIDGLGHIENEIIAEPDTRRIG